MKGLFPYLMEGRLWTNPQLADATGLSEHRVKCVVMEFKPSALDQFKAFARVQLSRPPPKNRNVSTKTRFNRTL